MKKRLLPFVLAGALTAAFAAPASAATCSVDQADVGRGGTAAVAALIAAAVDAAVAAGVNACDINIANDSLNNLLRNSDILNNSLNNLLRNADITLVDVDENVITVNVLSAPFMITIVD